MVSRKKNDEIYEVLRSRIYTGQLQGDSVLVESELAQEFSLSRTPIRQVLQRLAIENLIETRNGVGTIVVSEDLSGMATDLYCCKELLRTSSGLALTGIDEHAAFELSGLSSVIAKLKSDNSVETLWRYYSKMSQLVTLQIDHDILNRAISLLFGRIFRQMIICPQLDFEYIVQFVFEEHAAAMEQGESESLVSIREKFVTKIQQRLLSQEES